MAVRLEACPEGKRWICIDDVKYDIEEAIREARLSPSQNNVLLRALDSLILDATPDPAQQQINQIHLGAKKVFDAAMIAIETKVIPDILDEFGALTGRKEEDLPLSESSLWTRTLNTVFRGHIQTYEPSQIPMFPSLKELMEEGGTIQRRNKFMADQAADIPQPA